MPGFFAGRKRRYDIAFNPQGRQARSDDSRELLGFCRAAGCAGRHPNVQAGCGLEFDFLSSCAHQSRSRRGFWRPRHGLRACVRFQRRCQLLVHVWSRAGRRRDGFIAAVAACRSRAGVLDLYESGCAELERAGRPTCHQSRGESGCGLEHQRCRNP